MDGAVTARDIQLVHGIWKRDGSSDPGDFDAETYEYAKNETVSNFAADGIQLIDGGERVGFKQALKEHDQLTQDGHKNLAQTLDQAADAHDDGEIDEAAQRQIEQWYREHEDVAKSAFENAADADTFVDNLASLGCNLGGEN
jgi:hypothetical protein